MNADVDLDKEIRDLFAQLLGPQTGRFPRWGDSPQAATATAPRHWMDALRLRPARVVVASALVVAIAGLLLIWRPIPAGSPAGGGGVDIWAVTAFDVNRVVAVGGTHDDEGDLVVARSTDAGNTWEVLHPDAPALTTVATAGTRLFGATRCTAPYVTEEAGPTRIGPTPTSCLYVSDDEGATWRDLGVGRLVDPSFSDASHGWARSPIDLDDPQLVYQTADGGQSWTSSPSPCAAPTPLLQQIVAAGPGHAYALCIGNQGPAYVPDYAWQVLEVRSGSRPVVLSRSPDGGLAEEPARCLAIRPDGSGLLFAGDALYVTADHGATWLRAARPSDTAVQSVILVGSSSLGFAAVRSSGARTGIEATLDGGRTWHRLIAWDFWTGEVLPTDAGAGS
jgi:photosystem II stability/assembly factor-like uncharacterized protein